MNTKSRRSVALSVIAFIIVFGGYQASVYADMDMVEVPIAVQDVDDGSASFEEDESLIKASDLQLNDSDDPEEQYKYQLIDFKLYKNGEEVHDGDTFRQGDEFYYTYKLLNADGGQVEQLKDPSFNVNLCFWPAEKYRGSEYEEIVRPYTSALDISSVPIIKDGIGVSDKQTIEFNDFIYGLDADNIIDGIEFRCELDGGLNCDEDFKRECYIEPIKMNLTYKNESYKNPYSQEFTVIDQSFKVYDKNLKLIAPDKGVYSGEGPFYYVYEFNIDRDLEKPVLLYFNDVDKEFFHFDHHDCSFNVVVKDKNTRYQISQKVDVQSDSSQKLSFAPTDKLIPIASLENISYENNKSEFDVTFKNTGSDESVIPYIKDLDINNLRFYMVDKYWHKTEVNENTNFEWGNRLLVEFDVNNSIDKKYFGSLGVAGLKYSDGIEYMGTNETADFIISPGKKHYQVYFNFNGVESDSDTNTYGIYVNKPGQLDSNEIVDRFSCKREFGDEEIDSSEFKSLIDCLSFKIVDLHNEEIKPVNGIYNVTPGSKIQYSLDLKESVKKPVTARIGLLGTVDSYLDEMVYLKPGKLHYDVTVPVKRIEGYPSIEYLWALTTEDDYDAKLCLSGIDQHKDISIDMDSIEFVDKNVVHGSGKPAVLRFKVNNMAYIDCVHVKMTPPSFKSCDLLIKDMRKNLGEREANRILEEHVWGPYVDMSNLADDGYFYVELPYYERADIKNGIYNDYGLWTLYGISFYYNDYSKIDSFEFVNYPLDNPDENGFETLKREVTWFKNVDHQTIKRFKKDISFTVGDIAVDLDSVDETTLDKDGKEIVSAVRDKSKTLDYDKVKEYVYKDEAIDKSTSKDKLLSVLQRDYTEVKTDFTQYEESTPHLLKPFTTLFMHTESSFNKPVDKDFIVLSDIVDKYDGDANKIAIELGLKLPAGASYWTCHRGIGECTNTQYVLKPVYSEGLISYRWDNHYLKCRAYRDGELIGTTTNIKKETLRKPNELLGGKCKYTAVFDNEIPYNEEFEMTAPLPIEWNEAVFSYDKDGNWIAKRTSSKDSSIYQTDKAKVVETVITKPSCEKSGLKNVTYTFSADWAKSGDKTETVSIDKLTHEYDKPTYKFSDDMKTCTATSKCSVCGDTKTETVKVTANTTKPTCDAEGKTVYTATFADGHKETKTVKLDKLTHEYDKPTYKFSDDMKTCTATSKCSVCGDTKTETVKVTANTTKPTCDAEGKTVYTATFADGHKETKTVKQDKLAHDYSKPTYKFSDDMKTCTATSKCSVCGETKTETVDVVAKVLVEATQETMGTTRYVALFSDELGGEVVEDKIDIPKLVVDENEDSDEKIVTDEKTDLSNKSGGEKGNSPTTGDVISGTGIIATALAGITAIITGKKRK